MSFADHEDLLETDQQYAHKRIAELEERLRRVRDALHGGGSLMERYRDALAAIGDE